MKGGPNTTTTTSSSSHDQDAADNNNNNEYNNNEEYEQQQQEEEEDQEEYEEEEEEERPKLAEGFFEIESVRKKRSRKGKLQYLIKWRGWPETANTWEPFENLMSCSDIIDAFEERLKSGRKGSSKKQKRKLEVVSQAPPAKKKKKHHQQQQQQQQQQERGSPAATYDVPPVKVKLIEEPLSHPSGNGPTSSKWAESSAKGTGTVRKLKRLSDNGSSVVSRQIEEAIESEELNVKLSQLKGASSTDKEKIDELDVRIQDRSGEGISPSNGVSNVNGQNSVWVCRSGGAKRRKSGAVKRFKQDSQPVVTNHTPDAIDRIASANGVVLEPGIQNFDQVGNCFGSVNTVDTSRSMYAITKIIKPIEYSISKLNDLRDILVTFLVLRSDGKEIMVDNRYLKANYPLLLINFYEQHIQYASE
ncbi:chromo domain protein LHP1 [Artemisia annua]|uniref:Chromo domain protein LHP1 n=1 Tax=Artemisia annua TaxID=35608 RepID=A0A2U1LKY3_ARTAN|nr:chromo domain protein LHP1 [Artemisia annua]